jgi:hypothetical protein
MTKGSEHPPALKVGELLTDGGSTPPPVTDKDLQTARAVAIATGAIVRELARVVARWPGIVIVSTGLLLVAADFVAEIWDARLSSRDYIATLICGVVVCAVGAALEVNVSRQVRNVAETGIDSLVPMSDATRTEVRRLLSRGKHDEEAGNEAQ